MIVFLYVPADTRIKRLIARETREFGDRIAPDGDMSRIHREFLIWARGYDDPAFTGRSLAGQEAWMANQNAPVCRINGEPPLTESLAMACAALDKVAPAAP